MNNFYVTIVELPWFCNFYRSALILGNPALEWLKYSLKMHSREIE